MKKTENKNEAIKDYPGVLFLIVGNSGSGKDSIIEGVIKQFPEEPKAIYNPRRYITRPPSDTEENIPIKPDEFRRMQEKNKFAITWHIYGLDYAIPKEMDEFLKNGHPVIVNVSRTIIEQARKVYKNLKVIFIQVPFEITVERIKERGRENKEGLKERIERAKTHQLFPGADCIVDNSGELQDAIDQCLTYILSEIS
ncbi:MAG: phosphonate metabolism protein/1,5-bisphosphokinase (PRPP-forming) PhnN [Candidatus Lokiarchaeota archaeon]|nr:phosphonate metabolism protein/1,5-bisphosphokinase (PRPP-forming) PhnN [Candidatus Lokiarchaeota archaeon]MBD3200529.1 phosphonate metabolism protein/1,5-bisphosphokinase (PRPP-forming) PhnN [Candidatus Lokiarchaeota archaeon]